MNKRIVKQVIGIDVSQKELVISAGRMYDDWTPGVYGNKIFPNTEKGFGSLVLWVKKMTDESVRVHYVMEATGVYHESLAYYLDNGGYEVSIVLPNKISNYQRTLEIKTITDKTSSECITLFGLERKLDRWKRPGELYKKIRQLVRERDQLVSTRTTLKNQLHAELSEAEPNKSSTSRIKKQIALFDKHEQEVKKEIAELIKTDKEAKNSVAVMSSAPGIGTLTAAIVLAETNGFDLIRNKRQLSSYAGLDVKEKQSGTSVKGTPRISKRGNRYLRKAMYLPALAAIKSNERYKAVFTRLVSKHGIKKKAVIAVQRKLLELVYILYKTNKVYDKHYFADENIVNEE